MCAKSFILVFEQDPSELQVLAEFLGYDQYKVVGVERIDDAARYLKEPVDLVMSDLQECHPSALDLLRLWKQSRPSVPFIMVTGVGHIASAVDAMKFGADDYITKPVHPEELRIRIAKWLEIGRKNERIQLLESRHTGSGATDPAYANGTSIPAGMTLEALEKAAVEKALTEHDGNRTHAAKTLGISVRTLQRKLKAWGVNSSPPTCHSLRRGSISPQNASIASLNTRHMADYCRRIPQHAISAPRLKCS